MNRRDRAVVAALVLLLVGARAVRSRSRAPGRPGRGRRSPRPAPTLAAAGHLPRGRRRFARPRSRPCTRADPRGPHARRADLLRARAARPGQRDYEPDLAESWTTTRTGTDLDVHDPRRRHLAGRRAGHRRRRGVHGRGAQEPGRGRRRIVASWAEVDRRRRWTRRPCGSRSPRRSPGSSRSLTPAAAARRTSSRTSRSRTSPRPRLRPAAGRHRAVRAHRAGRDARRCSTPDGALIRPPSGRPGRSRPRTRWPHPYPAATPGAARPVPRADRDPVLRRRRPRWPRPCGRARSMRRRGLPAARGRGRSRDAAGIERLRYPTTTLSAVLLNLRPTHPELRERAGAPGPAGGDRPRRARGRTARRATPCAPTPSCHPARGPSTRRRAHRSPFDPKAAAKALTTAGWKKIGGRVGGARRRRPPTRSRSSRVPADANPRLAAVAGFVRDAWTAAGLQGRPGRAARRRARDPAAGGRRSRAAVVDIAMGLEPDLYPLLASSQVRRPASNLSGYQDPALDPLLEAARAPRHAGGAGRGLEGAAGRRWRSAADPAARLAGRGRARPRGVDGITPRLIVGPGRPILGCASMAPRRGPVSLRAPRSVVGSSPRWRNWQTR